MKGRKWSFTAYGLTNWNILLHNKNAKSNWSLEWWFSHERPTIMTLKYTSSLSAERSQWWRMRCWCTTYGTVVGAGAGGRVLCMTYLGIQTNSRDEKKVISVKLISPKPRFSQNQFFKYYWFDLTTTSWAFQGVQKWKMWPLTPSVASRISLGKDNNMNLCM